MGWGEVKEAAGGGISMPSCDTNGEGTGSEDASNGAGGMGSALGSACTAA